MINKPVVLIIFNRPDTTEKVFEAIRMAKPPKFLIISDGPRKEKEGEVDKCEATRAIINRVDWPCEVLKNFSESNLGCRKRVSTGLDWVFKEVDEAIILEDDCLPHPTFFIFCEELLDRFRNDERIIQISGVNFQFGLKRIGYSYYFSRYNHAWGWAAWRRSWKNYDVDMKLWPEVRDYEWLNDWLGNKKVVEYWRKTFEKVYIGKIDTWDYQWTFACWAQGGLSVLPNVNLISNIGFGPQATHTKVSNKVANLEIKPMKFPLSHPPFIIRDAVADSFTESLYLPPSRFKKKINKIINFFAKSM